MNEYKAYLGTDPKTCKHPDLEVSYRMATDAPNPVQVSVQPWLKCPACGSEFSLPALLARRES